ncbi:MAG: hypothetical protein V4449_01085 [Patescibacteria group bacterium]
MSEREVREGFIRGALEEILTTPDRAARLLSALPKGERTAVASGAFDRIEAALGSRDPQDVEALGTTGGIIDAYMDVHVRGNRPK